MRVAAAGLDRRSGHRSLHQQLSSIRRKSVRKYGYGWSETSARKLANDRKGMGCFRSLQWSQQLFARLNFALEAQLSELDQPEQHTGNDGNRLDGLKNQISMHRLSPPPHCIATKLPGVCNGR